MKTKAKIRTALRGLMPGLLMLAAGNLGAQTGPVGKWLLDDPVGSTTALDSSGNGNTGLSGLLAIGGGGSRNITSPTFGITGSDGTAASFNGQNTGLRVNNTIPKSFTVTAWIKTNDVGGGWAGAAYAGRGIVWSDIGGGGPDMIPMAIAEGRLMFGTGENNGVGYNTLTSTVPINTGEWVCAAVTRDVNTGVKQLYINGVLNASNGLGGTGALDYNPYIFIGTNPLDSSYFNGQIDNVSFYDRVLTAAEIEAHCMTNHPPTVKGPKPATVHCTSIDAAASTVTVNINDADNDALKVTWTVDGEIVATHSLPGGTTSDSLVDYPFPVIAPFSHQVFVSVTDNKSQPVAITATVSVAPHDAPAPSVAILPDITDECEVLITEAPTAIDDCDSAEPTAPIIGTTTSPLPISFTEQGTYTVTWTYTDPHDAAKSTTQEQTVIVKDITPPEITCPPNVEVAYGSVPAAATTPGEFIAQGGTITDNCNPNGEIRSWDSASGICPIIVTRVYVVADAAGNEAGCEQIITVNNLFAEDGIVWHQPLARNGMSEDTDPGAGGTLKYRFKLGSTIPIKVHAEGCDADVTANSNVTGRVVVFGDTDMDGVIDSGELPIDYNGVGEAGGVMDKIDSHLKYNLDTKKLVQTFKCYILQVTITDSSTGESRVEIVPLQAK